MNKRYIIFWLLLALTVMSSGVTAYADFLYVDSSERYQDGSYSEVLGYYEGYTLYQDDVIDPDGGVVTGLEFFGWGFKELDKSAHLATIQFEIASFYNYEYYEDATIRIPNNIVETGATKKGRSWTVKAIYGSGVWKTYDLNPNNEYMTCVDNVIFSKDQTTLMSYARYDERTEYIVPDGTIEIAEEALNKCNKLQKITLSETVERLDSRSLANDAGEVEFANLNVEIDRSAFGRASSLPTLTTYAQPTLTSEGTTIRWEEIEGATYYEVYQKLNDGEYRLLGTTSGGGCRFTTLKEGKEYTFAVKAYAEIPATNYDPEREEGVYPESFLIEGTMSEDIVLVG